MKERTVITHEGDVLVDGVLMTSVDVTPLPADFHAVQIDAKAGVCVIEFAGLPDKKVPLSDNGIQQVLKNFDDKVKKRERQSTEALARYHNTTEYKCQATRDRYSANIQALFPLTIKVGSATVTLPRELYDDLAAIDFATVTLHDVDAIAIEVTHAQFMEATKDVRALELQRITEIHKLMLMHNK